MKLPEVAAGSTYYERLHYQRGNHRCFEPRDDPKKRVFIAALIKKCAGGIKFHYFHEVYELCPDNTETSQTNINS